MKTYQSQKVAQLQSGSKTKKTGIVHMYHQIGENWLVGTQDEITAEIIRLEEGKKARKPSISRRIERSVKAFFKFLGENEKYVKVEYNGQVIQIGKSLVDVGAVDGNSIIELGLTPKYAAHRGIVA